MRLFVLPASLALLGDYKVMVKLLIKSECALCPLITLVLPDAAGWLIYVCMYVRVTHGYT